MNANGNFLTNGLAGMFDQGSMSDISLVVFLSMIAAAVIGFAIRRAPGLLLPNREETEGQEGYVVSAVLGLLALLMGFTFSLALDRYEDRRQMVLEEANAIGTAYLRAQLLPNPARSEISGTLTDYANNRMALARANERQPNFKDLVSRNDVLLVDLWGATVRMVDTVGPSPITSLSVSSINDVIDMDASRKNARAAKVPSAVYSALLIYLFISAGILGYTLVGFWARLAAVILFVLFTLALILIVDIDRPLVGQLREQQKPMEDLVVFMKTAPPAKFHPAGAE